MVIMIFFKI